MKSFNQIPQTVLAAALLLVAILTQSCGNGSEKGPDPRLLARLDSAIANKSDFIASKEKRIAQLKSLAAVSSGMKRYGYLDSLYSQYFSYNPDSAARYALLKARTADSLGDKRLGDLSRLHFTRMSLSLGNEVAALDTARRALSSMDDSTIAVAYYDAMATWAEIKKRNPLEWFNKMEEILPKGSGREAYNTINRLLHSGHPEEAVRYIDSNYEKLSRNPHDVALTHYLKAHANLRTGDTVAAANNLAVSAYNDIITPVRDYKSLYELAALMFKSGDVDHAYRYINHALEDGVSARVVDNAMAVNAMTAEIVKARENQVGKSRRLQVYLMVTIGLAAIVLGLSLWFTRRSRNQVSDINRRLTELNTRLKASNQVKDAYLLQYLNLCSYFMGALAQFRTSVSSALRTKGLEGVEQLLAKADDSRDLKRFYSNFDKTFLELFPDFVNGFNALVKPEAAVSLNKDGSMSNELRTFALIRLGITDSEQIATYLRRSVSTIYNYRVKMRNAAIVPRDQFETKVGEIGL